MNDSGKTKSFPVRGGLLALVALMVAFFAQAAGAEANAVPNASTTNVPLTAAPGHLPRQAVSSNPATIPVTTTTDGGPGSLRQAIADANAGDTITVPAGTYTLRNGELLIEKSLTIAGAGSAVTTINPNRASRAFDVVGHETELAVTISGVTVTNGKGTLAPLTESTGGAGINSEKTALTLRNDVFKHNTSSTEVAFHQIGGGTIEVVFGSLTMIGTTVTENVATGPNVGVFGGAVDVEQGNFVTIERSTISGNDVRSVEGGNFLGAGSRFFVRSSRIVGSTFSDNRAEALGEGEFGNIDFGGAILLIANGFPSSTNQLTEDTIAHNLVNVGNGLGEGGGILIGANTPVHISRGTFDSNRLEGGPESGGGNISAQSGETFISNSSVIHGSGPVGTENCQILPPEEEGELEAKIISEGFNRESTDQCNFHAVGDEVNLG